MSLFIKNIRANGVNYYYKDINIDYGQEAATTVFDQDALTQKILIVLATKYGSRKWRPFFGSKVYQHLFEPFDLITAGWIGQSIKQSLESTYNGLTEDIRNIRVEVLPDPETQTYYVKITWTAIKLQDRGQTEFNLDPAMV